MASGARESEAKAALPVLSKALDAKQPYVDLCNRYFDGDQRLRLATAKFKAAFGDIFATSSNWCPLIVECASERLAVTGFRFGPDEDADTDAWETWQANNLDAESLILQDEAIKTGSGYLLVAPPVDGDTPMMTVEHPSQCIVAYSAGNRRERIAALKRWRDEDGRLLSTVYLPEGAYKFEAPGSRNSAGGVAIGVYDANAWQPREGVEFFEPHDARAVQVVELRNNPTMLPRPSDLALDPMMTASGRSDLAVVFPLIDAANKLLCDLLVASEFYAFPQRVFTNLEVPTDDDGTPLDFDLKAALTRYLTFSDDVKVHQLPAGDLENYTKCIRELQLQIAAQTRIPAHYMLTGNSVTPSGESIKSVEAGLVKRARRKMLDFSDPYEEAQRIGFRMVGDETRGNARNAETIWADPETRTEAEHVDATLKLRGLLSDQTLMERLGMTPTEIEREIKRKEEQAKLEPQMDLSKLFSGRPETNGSARDELVTT